MKLFPHPVLNRPLLPSNLLRSKFPPPLSPSCSDHLFPISLPFHFLFSSRPRIPISRPISFHHSALPCPSLVPFKRNNKPSLQSRAAPSYPNDLPLSLQISSFNLAGALSFRSLQMRAVGTVEGREDAVDRGGGKGEEGDGDVKLRRLREEMARVDGGRGVDAFIIPSEDAHQSEYSAPCFERRAFISGFTGSAGTAVVTMDSAALWTDGRYFLQASKQLGKEWQLMRAGLPGVPSIHEWLQDTLPPSSRVAIDPFVHSAESVKSLCEAMGRSGCEVIPLLSQPNLVDSVWSDHRPPEGGAMLRVHELKYAGKSVREKLEDVRKELKEAGATALVVPMLDEVAWLFNLRGGDVPHCPVAIAYGVVEMEAARLFVDGRKVPEDVAGHLEEAGVSVEPYDSLIPYVQKAAKKGEMIWMDPTRVNAAVMMSFDAACREFYEKVEEDEVRRLGKKGAKKRGLVEGKGKGDKKEKKGKGGGGGGFGGQREEVGKVEKEILERRMNGPAVLSLPSPIVPAKAVKNAAEIEGMRNAHLRDGAALAEFWAWMEEEIELKGNAISEVEVAVHLEGFRKKQQGFLDTSFDTIAGSGANGAIIHYRAEEGTCADVDGGRLFLLDSGAQFVDGTTDVTRTVHFGEPSGMEKSCFTRVLQGHIALDVAVFPEGTPGFVLDVLARKSLWSIGLDYRHGTGHGVGAALNVHEGPQSISARFGNSTPLQKGMVVSNEPGFYLDGSFGIRIENLLVVVEAPTEYRFGGTQFYSFERLTLVPIQKKMLDLSIMTEEEIAWLNDYHVQVWREISPLVDGRALAWLKRSTDPVHVSSPSPVGSLTTS